MAMTMAVRADGKVAFESVGKGQQVVVVAPLSSIKSEEGRSGTTQRNGTAPSNPSHSSCPTTLPMQATITTATNSSGAYQPNNNSYGWSSTLEALYGPDAKDSTLVYRVVLSKLNSAENDDEEEEEVADGLGGLRASSLSPAVQRRRSLKRYLLACELLSTKPNKKISRLCFGVNTKSESLTPTKSVCTKVCEPQSPPSPSEDIGSRDETTLSLPEGGSSGSAPVASVTIGVEGYAKEEEVLKAEEREGGKSVPMLIPKNGLLDLSGEYLGVRGFLAFLMVLPRIPSDTGITKIDLSQLRIDTPQVTLLAQALGLTSPTPTRHSSPSSLSSPYQLISELDLSDNPFSSVGAQALVECVQKVPSLVEIKVEGVEMVASAHRKLMSALQHNRNKLKLNRS